MDVNADDEDEDEGTSSVVDVRARVLAAGFTEADLMTTIAEASRLGLPRQELSLMYSKFYSVGD